MHDDLDSEATLTDTPSHAVAVTHPATPASSAESVNAAKSHGSSWAAVAEEVGVPGDTSRSEVCFEVLRNAQASRLVDLLAGQETDDTSDPYLALLAAEAAFRLDPKRVFARVTNVQSHFEGTPELSLWAAALLADLALSQTSPEMLMPIVTGHYPTPTTPLGQLCALRIDRARLVVLGLGQQDWTHTRASLDRLDDDFCRLGATEEGATTGCIRASLDVVHGQPGIEDIVREVVATCQRLMKLGTDRSPTALLLAIGASHLAEDHTLVAELSAGHEEVFAGQSWQHAAIKLFTCTATYRHSHTAADLNEAETWFSLLVQRFAQPWLLVAEAHNFLDYEREAPARQTLNLALSSGLVTPQTVAGLNVLRARVAFLDNPDDVALQDLMDSVEDYVGAGLPGQATVFALRASLDTQRRSRHRDAERFYSLAVDLAGDRGLSNTERRLFHLATTASNFTGAPRVHIISLDETPRLLLDGERTSLGPLAAKVVLLLAGSPSGIALDSVLETLYPDVDTQIARSRFNLLLHRLREQLDSEPGELFTRDDSRVQLVRDRWYVDAWDFTRKAGLPATEARLAALALYRDNFGGTLGLFDDAIITIRHRLQVSWCDLVLSLLHEGVIDSDDVAIEADRLDIKFPRLLQALADYHRRESPG